MQIPTLRADRDHTVRSLTGRLLELVRTGMTDTGFPVLVKDRLGAGGTGATGEMGGDERGVLRVVGFLGMNELEHALGE
jgi:chloride channel 3/4/5